MSFKIGQKVVFLHEVGGGVVVSVDQHSRYIVEDENGFSKPYLKSDIAPVHQEDYKLGEGDYSFVEGEITSTKTRHTIRKEKANSEAIQENYWEIDLHIESLTDSHRGLSNTEIINKQMNAFKLFLNKARSKRMRKIVAIHGVGEGVLKHEVRTYLDKFDDLKYYDADYGEYGKGATTIELWYT
jgi:hypothetical protein